MNGFLLITLFWTVANSALAADTNCFAPGEVETNIQLKVRDLFISDQDGATNGYERGKLYDKADPTGQEIQVMSASTGKILPNVGMLDPGRTNFGIIKAGSCSLAVSQLKNNGADGSYVSRTVAPIFFIGNKKAILFDNLPSEIWGGSSASCSNPKPYSAAYYNGKFYVSYGRNKLVELSTDGSYRALSSKSRIGEIHAVGGAFYAEFFNEDEDSTLSTLNKYDPVTEQTKIIDYMLTGSFIVKNNFQYLIFNSGRKNSGNYKGLSNYKILNKSGQLIDIGTPAYTKYEERDLEIEFENLSNGGILARTYLQGHWRIKHDQEEVTLLDVDGQILKKWSLDGDRLSLTYKNRNIHIFENSSNDKRTNFKTKQIVFDEFGNELTTRNFNNSFYRSTPYEVEFSYSTPLRLPSDFGVWMSPGFTESMNYFTNTAAADVYDLNQPVPNVNLTPEKLSKWIILNCSSNSSSKAEEIRKRILKKQNNAIITVENNCEVKNLSIFGFQPEKTGIVLLQNSKSTTPDGVTVQFLRLVSTVDSYRTKIAYCLDDGPWSKCGKNGFEKAYGKLLNP